jgi:hypothetical protein
MSWRASEHPQMFKMFCQGGREETDVVYRGKRDMHSLFFFKPPRAYATWK